MNSIVLIDKPAGVTSFDIVRELRKRLKERKIGHAGVLDKAATGLLICATGKATKLLSIFENSYKIYIAQIIFGIDTDTYDLTGRVLKRSSVSLKEEEIKKALERFVGEIEQKPPPFSNVKYKGKRLYKYALRGESVEVKPRRVKIYSIDLLNFENERILVKVKCSKGTYIRSLAHDLGEKIGVCAVLGSLRRTYIYPFSVDEAGGVENPKLLTLKEALYFMDGIVVDKNSEMLVKNGVQPCFIFDCKKLDKRLYKILSSEDGSVLAVILRKNNNSYSYMGIFL